MNSVYIFTFFVYLFFSLKTLSIANFCQFNFNKIVAIIFEFFS
jgi:hypothetical protein